LQSAADSDERRSIAVRIRQDPGAKAMLERIVAREMGPLLWGLPAEARQGEPTITFEVLVRAIQAQSRDKGSFQAANGPQAIKVLRQALQMTLLRGSQLTQKAILDVKTDDPYYAEIVNERSLGDVQCDEEVKRLATTTAEDLFGPVEMGDLDEFSKDETRAKYGMTEMPDDDIKAQKGDSGAVKRIMEDISVPDTTESRRKQYEENMDALNQMKVPVLAIEPALGGGPAFIDGKEAGVPLLAKGGERLKSG